MKKIFLILSIAISSLMMVGCSKDNEKSLTEIYGCMDSLSTNYNPDATADDGSCEYSVSGCTDPFSDNYNPMATTDDGTCIPWVNKFLAVYDANTTNNDSVVDSNYDMVISTDTITNSPVKVIINNFGNLSINVLVTVNESDITIDSASYNGIVFTGNGFIDGNLLTINYVSTDTFQIVATKN